MNILKSDLNLESRNSIHNYIDEFKKDILLNVKNQNDYELVIALVHYIMMIQICVPSMTK